MKESTKKKIKLTIIFPKKKKIIKWPWFHGLWEKWKVLKRMMKVAKSTWFIGKCSSLDFARDNIQQKIL